MGRKLTAQQARFVNEYVISLNASDAARKAGYSPHTAQEQSSRLLSKVIVQEAIQKALEARQKRSEVSADKVLAELAKIAFDEKEEDGMAYRDQHKMKALELLGKHFGMFTDKLQIEQRSVEHVILSVEDDEE